LVVKFDCSDQVVGSGGPENALAVDVRRATALCQSVSLHGLRRKGTTTADLWTPLL